VGELVGSQIVDIGRPVQADAAQPIVALAIERDGGLRDGIAGGVEHRAADDCARRKLEDQAFGRAARTGHDGGRVEAVLLVGGGDKAAMAALERVFACWYVVEDEAAVGGGGD
jgi:hypothetical protein